MDEWLLSRFRQMTNGVGLEIDACSKSLRGYSTRAFAPFIDRLRVHYPDTMDQRLMVHGKTFRYQRQSDGYSGSNLMNDIFSSFYVQEQREGEEVNVIYPKVSSKTVFHDPGAEGSEIMRDNVTRWVKDYSSNGVVALRVLVSSALKESVSRDLFDDYRNSSLSRSILDFLVGNEFTFPASQGVQVPNRITHRDLIMGVKYYPARDDNRAYCTDTNRLRQLVGSCLNRLVLPKSKKLRYQLQTSSVFNNKEKDMLALRAPIATRDGYTTKLLLLDISNFTGSFANAWLMLHCMALDASDSLSHKYSMFGFGDTLLVAGWFELLATYLYLTVGYPCYVEDFDETHTLPGGFLGVQCNITSSMLCLAVILKYLRSEARRSNLIAECQAGGDDSGFILHGPTNTVEFFVRRIRETVESLIGHLKEFQVVNLDDHEGGLIPDVTFCRKRVIHERTGRFHFISSEAACPIHQSLLPGSTCVRLRDQVRAWNELDSGLRQYETEHNRGAFRQIDALRMAFLLKYPAVRPTRVRTTIWCSQRLVKKHGLYFSEKALKVIGTVECVRVGPLFALQSFRSQYIHALHLDLVTWRKVWYRGESVECILTHLEEKVCERSSNLEEIHIHADPDYLDRLLKIIK